MLGLLGLLDLFVVVIFILIASFAGMLFLTCGQCYTDVEDQTSDVSELAAPIQCILCTHSLLMC